MNENYFIRQISQLDWTIIIIMCATLGLAPFSPPHIVEKLQMLFRGTLVKPLDWFDLFLHSAPWFILFLKIAVTAINKKGA